MHRRNFLKTVGTTALSAPFVFSKAHANSQALSPISILKHSQASTVALDSGVPNMTVNTGAVNAMVDNLLMQHTGKSTAGLAWESLFPTGSLTTATKIAIKVNHSFDFYLRSPARYYYTAPPRMCPWGQKAVISEAIIGGLTQMLDGTFPIENITVFDKQVDLLSNDFSKAAHTAMVNQGYPATMVDPLVDGYKVSGPGLYNIDLVDYRNTTVMSGMPSFNAGKSRSIRQVVFPTLANSDFWINVAMPKDHNLGYTGMLKCCYGCTDNCGGTHPSGYLSLAQECIPDFYPNLTAITPCILNFFDALAGLYDGGPTWGKPFYPNTVACSTDILTMEYYGMELVNQARRSAGYSDIGITQGNNPDDHVNASYLTRAQGAGYTLGNYNAGARTLHDLSSGTLDVKPASSLQKPFGRIQSLNRYGAGFRLTVSLDPSRRLHAIESRIFDVRGATVKEFQTVQTRFASAELNWDGKSNRGLTVAGGIYTWQVKINGRAFHQSVRVG